MGFVISRISNSWLKALEMMAEYEAVLFIGIQEILDSKKCIAEQETGSNGSAIANAQPDHFRRASTQNAQFRKIGILSDNDEAVLSGIIPNLIV